LNVAHQQFRQIRSSVPLIQDSASSLVAELMDPSAYPWRVETVNYRQTHISHLFFAGDRVVKLKRPVKYGFADLTSLASREQACRDEVRLNRRLTEDIYLNVLPITRNASGVRLGGNGEPIEWATVMRRFPAGAALDHLLENNAAPRDLVDRLANRLIPFHTSIEACPGSPEEQAASAEQVLRENLTEIAALDAGIVFPYEFQLIRNLVLTLIDHRPEAIYERARSGMIREGHGDLKCEHVLLDPPGSLQVFDCVEFSLAIRCADVASDLAFLLLDLERLGAIGVAEELVARYRIAGIALPDDQLRLYKLHRGLVKVKTTALTSSLNNNERTAEVARWLHLVFKTGYQLAPTVIAMTGFSGSGKSVVAHQIAAMTGALLLSTDTIRRESGANDQARYAPAARLANYQRLIERAKRQLAHDAPVILDGAFLRSEERALAADLAVRIGAPLIFVDVRADTAVVDRRIAARSAGAAPAFDSEATREVLALQRLKASVPFPENSRHAVIDNSTDAPPSLDPLLRLLIDEHLLSARSS
jgi:aminoglycoside phosphotransferase family enzyme/predicted kinase